MSFPPAAGRARPSRSISADSIWAASPTPMFPATGFRRPWPVTTSRSHRHRAQRFAGETQGSSRTNGPPPERQKRGRRRGQAVLDRRRHDGSPKSARNSPSPKRDRPIRPLPKSSPSRSPSRPTPSRANARSDWRRRGPCPSRWCFASANCRNSPSPTASGDNPPRRQPAEKRPRPDRRRARRIAASRCRAWSMARFCPAAWTVTAFRRARAAAGHRRQRPRIDPLSGRRRARLVSSRPLALRLAGT